MQRQLSPSHEPSVSQQALWNVEDAYLRCERLARTQYENFSLGTWFLPSSLKRHLFAIYAFCRGVDDLGDQASGNRLLLLDEWERQLTLCYRGVPRHPYFVALQQTIHRFDIPKTPFLKLIEANRRDQTIKRYPNYRMLLDYCDHSANPVGHLVLYVLGHRGPELQALSDNTSTALQLTNFWQDISRDFAMDRVYLPEEEMVRFGVTEHDLGKSRATPEVRDLIRFQVNRAQVLFTRGLPLVNHLSKFARVDVALFTAGGMSILRAIERQRYDVLAHRPALSKWGKGKLLASVMIRSWLSISALRNDFGN